MSLRETNRGYAKTVRFPLSTSYLCADCDCVTDNSMRCPCGSQSLMTLSAVLNRKIDASRPREQKAEPVIARESLYDVLARIEAKLATPVTISAEDKQWLGWVCRKLSRIQGAQKSGAFNPRRDHSMGGRLARQRAISSALFSPRKKAWR